MTMGSTSTLSGALALALVAGACTDSSTNPVGGREFNPAQTSSQIQPVSSVFSTPTMASFSALGEEFVPPGASGAAAPARALIEAAHDGSSSFAVRAADATRAMSLGLAAGSRAELIPPDYQGTTYVYVSGQGYQQDAERTDAPANGMRFVLYAVDPVSDEIVEPLVETGHVDFLDESTENTSSVRLLVVSGGMEYLNYAVTVSGTFNAPVFTIEGFATDGVDRVDFSLTNAIVVTFAGVRIDVDYVIDLANSDVHIDVDASVDQSTGLLTVDGSVSHGDQSARIQGTVNTETEEGQLEVTANGSPFATITLTPTGITAVNPDGQPLSQQEIDALEQITDVFGDTFDAFENLIDPVKWLFPSE